MARLASLTLLVGAHKTASSHLQNTLLSVRERLAVEGIGLIGPREVRKYLSIALQPEGRSATETTALARAALSHLCPGARHIVVMEENLLGLTQRAQLMGPKGLLYPYALGRLRDALAAFGGAELRLGLAIRNPATFLPSCWSEQLLHGPWQSFRDYVAGTPPAMPRWSALTGRLLQELPALTLWTYEDYPAVLAQIIDWATGLPGFGATVPPDELRSRPGLSQRAADLLHAKMQADPARDHRVLNRRARWAAPLHAGLPPFAPWSEAERARFDEAYEDDLLTLATLGQVHRLMPLPG